MLETVLVWIGKSEKRFLGDLKGWLGMPSVSAQPERAGDLRMAMEWAKDYLRTMGMEVEVKDVEVDREGHGEHRLADLLAGRVFWRDCATRQKRPASGAAKRDHPA